MCSVTSRYGNTPDLAFNLRLIWDCSFVSLCRGLVGDLRPFFRCVHSPICPLQAGVLTPLVVRYSSWRVYFDSNETPCCIRCILRALGSITALGGVANPAQAGYCWNETYWYEKWNCQTVGKTQLGKYILLCCN